MLGKVRVARKVKVILAGEVEGILVMRVLEGVMVKLGIRKG